MNSKENSTGSAGDASTSGRNYSAMSVYDIYLALTTLVGIKQFYNLTCMGQADGFTAVFEWAEAREEEVDAEMLAMSKNLTSRMGLSRDDEDLRDLAFARIDGYVPSGIWLDGRIERMRSVADITRRPQVSP
ncbi:hypothetical protein [Devosia sp.]|uniref:hypothetical protein n=1 Tax=Devosia sp. TaxID=1871048 RepID=UPI001B0AC285|nr:hypothetical protein [Devosia sp.]MBO9589090.1 hypothetical protein [Devosia sp.]